MTSYLVVYMKQWQWAKLSKQSDNGQRKPGFRFGLLPHEIAALNVK